jgi:hypothetical protein
MRLRKPLVLAALLIALVLATAPSHPEVAGLFLFLGVLVPAGLWLLGITRTPRFARDARKARAQRAPVPPRPHAGVTPAEFRYPRKRAATIVLYLLALLPAGLTLFVLAEMGSKAAPVVAVLGLSTALQTWVAYRIPHIAIRIGPEGLHSVEMFDTIRMAWDDVVALGNRDHYARGNRIGGEVQLYSQNDRLSIGEQLIGFQELLAIVEANVRPG